VTDDAGRGTSVALLEHELGALASDFSLPEDLSYEQWAALGDRIRRAANAVLWTWGEWWLYGEHHYGDAAYQAAPTGYRSETLRKAAWVCSRIPREERDDRLPFGHFSALARLEDSVARATFRDRAIAEDWTVRETERAVSQAKSGVRDEDVELAPSAPSPTSAAPAAPPLTGKAEPEPPADSVFTAWVRKQANNVAGITESLEEVEPSDLSADTGAALLALAEAGYQLTKAAGERAAKYEEEQ
jgi:HTH domain found in ParB protein